MRLIQWQCAIAVRQRLIDAPVVAVFRGGVSVERPVERNRSARISAGGFRGIHAPWAWSWRQGCRRNSHAESMRYIRQRLRYKHKVPSHRTPGSFASRCMMRSRFFSFSVSHSHTTRVRQPSLYRAR